MTTEPKTCACRISGPLGIGAVLGDGVTRLIDGTAYGVTYCPTHAAAPEMLMCLQRLVKFLEWEEERSSTPYTRSKLHGYTLGADNIVGDVLVTGAAEV